MANYGGYQADLFGESVLLVDLMGISKDYCRSGCNDRGVCTPSYAFESLMPGIILDESTGALSCSPGYSAESDLTSAFEYPFVSGTCTGVDCPVDSYGDDVGTGCTCIDPTVGGSVIATSVSPYYNSTCTAEDDTEDYTSAAVLSTPFALFNGMLAFLVTCM